MVAYYNEIDKNAAAWLRELMKQGMIAQGDIDDRDIRDIRPDEMRGYTQCHFFAGIGGWSHALRLAGWADERPVWTGSCPCQPFSAAGARGGVADERHLWPHWHHLISQCRPPIVFGEQVASKDGLGWLDLVCSDMEGSGYAIGTADLCAAGVGAPHIRQRLWFVGLADADSNGRNGGDTIRPDGEEHDTEHGGSKIGLADAAVFGRREGRADTDGLRSGDFAQGSTGRSAVNGDVDGGLADAGCEQRERREGAAQRREHDGPDAGWEQGYDGPVGGDKAGDGSQRPSQTDSPWGTPDWLFCRDGKWRPVEPGTFPLAHGLPARVGRLRGYGNAIVPQVAATFIRSVMDLG